MSKLGNLNVSESDGIKDITFRDDKIAKITVRLSRPLKLVIIRKQFHLTGVENILQLSQEEFEKLKEVDL